MFTKQTHTLQIDLSSLHYAIIPWDSNYLHNTTIEIENFSVKSLTALKKAITQLQHELRLKKGDLMFIKVPPHNYSKIHMLDQAGFYYVEQTVTLDIDLSTWKPWEFTFQTSDTYHLIPAGLPDKKEVRNIARTTFTADRFHLDPHIPKSNADYRFEMWIENSFHNKDSIYKFIDSKRTIIGFFIFRDHPKYAEFRLAGLHPRYVGRGLGKALYHSMYSILKAKGHTRITSVISLNNTAVLNVNMYLGHVKFIDPRIVLHRVI